MADEKDRFGDKMRLVERAREDIYFAAKDRELIEKLKARMQKVERADAGSRRLTCPKCEGKLQSYKFMDVILDQCHSCGGIWLDKGEMEVILAKVSRSPLWSFVKSFIGGEDTEKK